MLALINNVCGIGCFHEEKKDVVIVSILKPNNYSSYRPFTLTSVPCKIMEQMISDRLVQMLKKR